MARKRKKNPDQLRFNFLVDKHQLEALRLGDIASARLLATYEKARREIVAALMDAEARGLASSGRLQAILADVDRLMAGMDHHVTEIARPTFAMAYETGIDHILREVGVYEDLAAVILPRVPTRVVELVNERSMAFLEGLSKQQRDMLRTEIEVGIIRGQTMAEITQRLLTGEAAQFKMSYASAMRTVRQAVGESYNGARVESIRAIAEDEEGGVPGIGKRWLSRLKDSTPICLALHGQFVPADGLFSYKGGAWKGAQPWAVWQGAEPRYHICHSVVVPDHPDWPPNPRLAPLAGGSTEAKAKDARQRWLDMGNGKL